MAVQMSSRDGADGYGPGRLWWAFNFGYFFLASLFVYSNSPMQQPFGLASALHVVVRNVSITVFWYGGWHYLLYVRRILPEEGKFNKDWNAGYESRRDTMLTISGSLMASMVEISALALWTSGRISYDTASFWRDPVTCVWLIACAAYWSDLHFWFAHRSMHPWFKTKSMFDPGRFVYQHVHKVHHKSYNPGPWSGLAMHPVEHLIYFTRALPFLAYPPIFLFVNTRAMIGPAPGHHGFGDMGGSFFHYIHHAKFEYNFGTSRVVPIDNFLGTYRDASETHTKDTSARCVMWLLGLPYLVPLSLATWASAKILSTVSS